MRNIYWSLFLVGLLLVSACSSTSKTSTPPKTEKAPIEFLEGDAAKAAIIQDRTDSFFELIRPLDVTIQIKNPIVVDGLDGQKVMSDLYKTHIQESVQSFTEDEKKYIQEVMNVVYTTANKINRDIYDRTIKIIKTDGNHYGASVYYTREDIIIIPFNVLLESSRDKDQFTQTMFHELFHIYSRYHPTKREQLYALIGFQKAPTFSIPSALDQRILLNPDGIDINYMISLTLDDGNKVDAIPVVFSTQETFNRETPNFFSYLKFDLFPLEKKEGKWEVKIKEQPLASPLDLRKIPDFFKQIGPNTQYIIHPDEILADNFAILAGSKINNSQFESLKDTGKQLVREIEKILIE